MNSFRQDQLKAQADEQRRENFAVFEQLQALHPEISWGEATRKMFEEYINFGDMPLSLEEFEAAYANLRAAGKLKYVTRRVPTEAEVKEELIDRICELIASKNNGRDGKFGEFELKAERGKLGHQSVQQLTQRLQEITRRQHMASGSTAKDFLADVRKAEAAANPYLPYELLPQRGIHRGEEVEFDAPFFRLLAKTDIYTFKRFHNRFGGAQLTARMNG